MEAVPHPLLVVTAEDIKKVHQFYGIDDPNRIQESLDSVYEWCQKQNHLAEGSKHMNRAVLERLFLLAGGSVEGTKKRVDKLLTCRGLMSELLLNRSLDEFNGILKCVTFLPLPKLCPVDQSRILVTKLLHSPNEINNFTMLSFFRYFIMVAEYRYVYDYGISERHVLDLEGLNLSFFTKINPIIMKKAETLGIDGHGAKVKGIHILNAPPYVDKLISIFKQVLSEKVASRIQVHSTYDDLHQHIPKEVLPKEYGGNDKCFSDLAALWNDTLKTEEARKIINEYDKMVSDETKRDSSRFNEEILGMPGSFRMLNVD